MDIRRRGRARRVVKRKLLKALFIALECIAFIGVIYLAFMKWDSFEAYMARICLILLSVFGICFYNRFRSNDANDFREKKRIARYTSDRRDIEEKISSL